MGRKCCVWHCKSGYDSESDSEKKKPDYEPVPIYAFPVNEEEKNVWCDGLPKSTVNKETDVTWLGVCRKHFAEDVPMVKICNRERPALPPEYWLNEALP